MTKGKLPSKPAPDSFVNSDTPEENSKKMVSLYSELRNSLKHFAYRYLKKRPHDVEDVVQEAFVKIIEAQQRQDIHYPRSYMYQTVKNLALNQLDKSENRLTDTVGDFLPETVLLETATMEDQFESWQQFELFCRAVRELPAKCRRVYVLRRVYGFSQKEIAEEMGISLKTVEAHLTKAIIRCAESMGSAETPKFDTTVRKQRERHNGR